VGRRTGSCGVDEEARGIKNGGLIGKLETQLFSDATHRELEVTWRHDKAGKSGSGGFQYRYRR
jgi:hypothetical protein